jgi:hypothetical protein
MSDNKLTIFHLYRKDGSSFFLYPFKKKQNLINILENSDISGLYGKEPRVESLTLLRNELYRQVEQSVKDWTAEKKFIPRFLISTAVFLVSYFLLSFVIRDPLPMLDELLIGIAAAVIVYIILVKRDSDSKRATEMKVKLRNKIDSIVFNEDGFTKDVESFLQNCETSSDLEQLLVNMMKDERSVMFDCSDKQKVQKLLNSIILMFDENDIKKHEKILNKLTAREDYQSGRSRMIRWMSSRKVDPFLFAVYTEIVKQK